MPNPCFSDKYICWKIGALNSCSSLFVFWYLAPYQIRTRANWMQFRKQQPAILFISPGSTQSCYILAVMSSVQMWQYPNARLLSLSWIQQKLTMELTWNESWKLNIQVMPDYIAIAKWKQNQWLWITTSDNMACQSSSYLPKSTKICYNFWTEHFEPITQLNIRYILTNTHRVLTNKKQHMLLLCCKLSRQ